MKFDEKCNYDLVFSILSFCLASCFKPLHVAGVLLQHIMFVGETLNMDSESFYAGGYSAIEKSVTLPLLPSFFTRQKSAFQKVSFLTRTCDTHASYPWRLAMYHYLHAEIHGSLSGPMRRLEPLTWQSLTACVLAGVCGLLNFLRCFPFLNVIVIDEEVRKL